jgi:hypothetical protein
MLELFAQTAWKVALAGLVLGAGLPAVFALGVRFSAAGAGDGDGASTSAGSRATARTLAGVCFLVVALAVALGITVVVASGFGKMVSFDSVYPTLVDKG